MQPFRAVAALAFSFLLLPAAARASCGAAFCTIDTQWDAQAGRTSPGWSGDLRYEFVDLDQPRTGRRRLRVGEIARHHDEVRSLNRNLLASVDYTFDDAWALRVTVPVVDRDHAHIHHHRGAALEESWNFTRLGDVRVVARRACGASQSAGDARSSAWALHGGVKLPTGAHDVRNASGEPAERSLQPGTGTTDVLLGLSFRQALLSHGAAWFAQALYERPLGERAGYRPGPRLGVDLGVRYEATDRLAVMLQLNAVFRGRDRGAEAEPADTGAYALFLSPGISHALSDTVQAYAFYQHPLYQHVRGVQLTTSRALVVGIGMRF